MFYYTSRNFPVHVCVCLCMRLRRPHAAGAAEGSAGVFSSHKCRPRQPSRSWAMPVPAKAAQPQLGDACAHRDSLLEPYWKPKRALSMYSVGPRQPSRSWAMPVPAKAAQPQLGDACAHRDSLLEAYWKPKSCVFNSHKCRPRQPSRSWAMPALTRIPYWGHTGNQARALNMYSVDHIRCASDVLWNGWEGGGVDCVYAEHACMLCFPFCCSLLCSLCQ